MWDSTGANGSAEPNTAKLPIAVVDQADGTQNLVLSPTKSFLNDADTKYPVIIDPVIQPYNPSYDTYVQSNMTTTNFTTSTELHVGVQTDGGAATRSFLGFDATAFQAAKVTSATLTLYQTQSTTCTATPMTVYASGVPNGNTRWPAQPGIYDGYSTSISVSKGYSTACPAGSYGTDVTALTDYLASKNIPTIGMRLSASETLRSGWKNINSADNTAHKPNLQVTYNRYPHDAAAPTVSPVTKYDGVSAYANSTTLTFGSSAEDPDGSNTLVRYEVYRTSDPAATNLIGGCDSGGVASGALATCIFHNTFPSSGSYYVRALGQDGQLWSKSWSANTAFNVGIDAPPVPIISCDTVDGGPLNQDGATIPAPENAVHCTVGVSPEGGASAAVNVGRRVDGGTITSTNIMPGDGGVFDVTIPNTAGRHVVATSTTNALGMNSSAGFTITFADVTPATPTISCPAPFVNGYTAMSIPPSAIDCTVNVSNQTFDASNGSFDIFLDGLELDSVPFTNGATTSTTVSVPATGGVHRISATSDAFWGDSSPETTYSFSIPGPGTPDQLAADPWVPVPDAANPDNPSATNFTPTLSSFSNDVSAEVTTYEIRTSTDAAAGSLIQTCVSDSVSTGGAATCQAKPLPEGTYFVRSRATDSGSSSAWSDWLTLPVSSIVNTEVLPPAVVTCPSITNGQWDQLPQATPVTCTVTAPSAPSGSGTLEISLDGESLTIVALATSTTIATPVIVPAGAAGHHIVTTVVEVTDGPASTSEDFSFGSGNWSDANLIPNLANGANSDSLYPGLWVSTDGAPLPAGTTIVYTLSANPDGTNPILVSPSSPKPLAVENGTLTVGATYYWNAQVQGPNNYDGTTESRISPWFHFVATDLTDAQIGSEAPAAQLKAAASGTAKRCGTVTFLGVRGTSAPAGKGTSPDGFTYKSGGYGNTGDPINGLVAAITNTVPIPVWKSAIIYPATSGFGYTTWNEPDYWNSVNIGRANLIGEMNNLAKACPSTFIWLGGHSQGADIVGAALSYNYDDVGKQARKNLRGVVMSGDPTYQANEKIDAKGNGTTGGFLDFRRQHGALDNFKVQKPSKVSPNPNKKVLFVRSYCKAGDMWCQTCPKFWYLGNFCADGGTIHNGYGTKHWTDLEVSLLTAFVIKPK